MINSVSPHSALFENQPIRRVYEEATETWWFSVVDIIRVLTQQADATVARKYWNKLKQRLRAEGSELVTNCHQLKLTAEDGKQRLTDVANAETLLRLVQSVSSPKAEPIKLWLAKVGYERIKEIADPAMGRRALRTRFNPAFPWGFRRHPAMKGGRCLCVLGGKSAPPPGQHLRMPGRIH